MDAPSKAQEFKALVATLFATITAIIGWTGWLLILWLLAMVVDWRLGVRYAKLNNEYSSDVARKGRWHKIGGLGAAFVAACLDISIQIMAQEKMGIVLPWDGVIVLPVVIMWYLFNEAGSIIENCAKLGAPVPDWLRKGIKEAQHRVDQTAGKPLSGWEMEHSATDDSNVE